MTSSVVSKGMYVILGASGNTGSIIANSLLSAGQKVRVVGRDSGRLQRSRLICATRLRSPELSAVRAPHI